MRFKLFFLVVLLALIASPAYGGWDNDEDGIGVAAVGCEEVQPNPNTQRRCYWNFVAAEGTGYSPRLDIDQCENFSVAFTPDYNAAGAATGTVSALICLDDAIGSVPESCYVLENTILNNNPATNTEVVYGADGTWLYIDIIVVCGAAANCRVEFRCNQ